MKFIRIIKELVWIVGCAFLMVTAFTACEDVSILNMLIIFLCDVLAATIFFYAYNCETFTLKKIYRIDLTVSFALSLTFNVLALGVGITLKYVMQMFQEKNISVFSVSGFIIGILLIVATIIAIIAIWNKLSLSED